MARIAYATWQRAHRFDETGAHRFDETGSVPLLGLVLSVAI